VSPLGLPADRTQVSRDLLASIDQDGIPVPGPQGLTSDEFHYWERDEPDLQALIAGQSVCKSDGSPPSASSATFDLKSAEYRRRLPVIRVRPAHRRTELGHLSKIRGPPQTSSR
jgi:hypothetical protein